MRRGSIKTMTGCGRKRINWKVVLHGSLLQEFIRMRSASVKIDGSFLQNMAYSLVTEERVTTIQSEIENDAGRPLADVITLHWVADFCNRFQIVTRMRTGNKLLSPDTMTRNHKFLALGVMKWMYEEGLDPSTVENYDETHMFIDMENGRVLESANLAIERDCFTVCFRISNENGGRIEAPLVVFQNPNSSYPIAGLHGNIHGIKYRSSPKV